MKEFKGTPGSWVVDGDYDVTTEDGTVVAWAAKGIFEPDEITANAHLIAAAPDLLEALQNIVKTLDEAGCEAATVEAKAAISKALREE